MEIVLYFTAKIKVCKTRKTRLNQYINYSKENHSSSVRTPCLTQKAKKLGISRDCKFRVLEVQHVGFYQIFPISKALSDDQRDLNFADYQCNGRVLIRTKPPRWRSRLERSPRMRKAGYSNPRRDQPVMKKGSDSSTAKR